MKLPGRIGLVIVAVLVLVDVVAATTMAAPPPWTPAAQKAKFVDVADDHWAAAVIQKVRDKKIVGGYEDGSFRPSNVVKRVEALVMIVNAVLDGEEIEEYEETDLVFKHLNQAPWAVAHIAAALEEDIITRAELADFRPQQAAKRYEVAMWLARAIDAGGDFGKEILEAYKDYAEVPARARRALGVLVRKGIMKGTPGKELLPNKPVTRAEMAALLGEYLDGIGVKDPKDKDQNTGFWGTVLRVDEEESRIRILTAAGARWFAIDTDEIYLWLDGKEVEEEVLDIADIRADYLLYLVLDSNGEVIYVGVCVGEGDYEGTITALRLDTRPWYITVEDAEGMEMTFVLQTGTEYEGEGVAGRGDLRKGMEVVITAAGGLASAVEVVDAAEDIVEGLITRYLKELNYIWLDGQRHALSSTLGVEIDGEDKNREALEEDWYAVLRLREGEVFGIEAWSPLKGTILAYDEDDEEIIVEVQEDDEVIILELAAEVLVFIDHDEEELEDLLELLAESNLEATIYHKGDDIALRIYATTEDE